MIAVDANILLRLIVADDIAQLDRVQQLLAAEGLFVPLTVILECEWVLRSFYKYRRDDVVISFQALIALDGVTFEYVEGVQWALDRLVAGADFADMIHIVQSKAAGATSFVTFDENIASRAGSGALLPVRTLD